MFSVTALDPALVGLSITYAVTLVNVTQYFIRTNAEVENLVSLFLNLHATYHVD